MAGNGLVEESYICKLLEGGSLDTLKESGLRDEMFLTCKDQIQFIQKHEAEYKQLPDKMIFLQKFKDFQMLEVTESMDYLADRIKEQFLYTKLVPIVQEGGNLLREDSLKAYDYLRAALETLQKDNPVSKNREGVDIISSAKDRLSSYLKRCDMKGLMGIPTGLTQLDDITNGWLFGEELVIITGRTNVGKSWIAEFFGTVAWEAGYKILQYSGEMSVEMVGFRFDTLHKHFSNMGLLNGSGILGKKEGSDGAKLLQDDYKNYIEWSGSKSQVTRKLEITVVNAPYDPNIKQLNLKLAETLYLYSDDLKTEYFRGFIVERERSSKTGNITYTAYDLCYYTMNSKATYNFKGKTAEKITKIVCDDLKIPTGSLAKTGHSQKLIVKDKTIYDIIMSAYTQAHQVNKKLYMVTPSKGKLNVVEYGATICTYELDEDTNITESAFKETLENMVNKVRIYDGDGKQIGVVQNTGNQKYGIFQETYTKEKNKNATTTAKAKLHGIDKTATIKALGNKMMGAITGNGIAVVDKATGLKGLFWITGDTHVWEKGVHTMTLTLEFKKAMDTKEV